jgi:hypothetical protein
VVPMSICPDKDVRCHTFLVKVALLVCGWKAWKSICRVKRLDRRSIYGYNSLPRKGEKPNAKVIATFTNGVVGAPSQPSADRAVPAAQTRRMSPCSSPDIGRVLFSDFLLSPFSRL